MKKADLAGGWSSDGVLHLHGLKYHQCLSLGHNISHLALDLHTCRHGYRIMYVLNLLRLPALTVIAGADQYPNGYIEAASHVCVIKYPMPCMHETL